jgi:uncharacterized protein (DUF58 family)
MPNRGSLGRWLAMSRHAAKRLAQPLDSNSGSTPAPPRTPAGRSGPRGVLERTPAPRGGDALHDKSQIGHLFQWFGDQETVVNQRPLAQRASEVLAGLGPLQLPARQVGDGLPGGLHRSLRRGAGVEFSEHKEYAPGDDLRHLDWKAYARSDRYYIKRFEQEVHATLTLVVDASASMQFADLDGDKFDAVRLTLACLALVLVRQGDSVALHVLGRPELTLHPGTGLRHFGNLAERLEKLEPTGQAGLDALGPTTFRGESPTGLVVVASDALLRPLDAVSPLAALHKHGADVLLLHTLHPRERDLQFHGPTQLVCRETDNKKLMDPRVIRHAYTQLMQAHCAALRTAATHQGVGYLLMDAALEPRGLIRQVLAATTRLRHRGEAAPESGAYGDAAFDADVLLAAEAAATGGGRP